MPRMLFLKHSSPAQDSAATNEENTVSTSVECFPLLSRRVFILQWEESVVSMSLKVLKFCQEESHKALCNHGLN